MKKVCFKCEKEKDIGDFYKHPKMGDGHLGKCKECTKKDVFKNYRKNISYYKEYDLRRNKTPDRKGQFAERQVRQRANNPQKYKANTAVGNAIRDGRLAKLPCEKCGDTKDVQAHHDDYSRPLDVRWLCFKHHKEVHGQVVT